MSHVEKYSFFSIMLINIIGIFLIVAVIYFYLKSCQIFEMISILKRKGENGLIFFYSAYPTVYTAIFCYATF